MQYHHNGTSAEGDRLWRGALLGNTGDKDIAGGHGYHHSDDYGMAPSPTPPPQLPETSAQRAPGAKRGRKPGPLPRAERQAQRKLNHSIIEKTRRSKINDALATLRELVPPDWQGHSTNNGNGSSAGTSSGINNSNNNDIYLDDRIEGAGITASNRAEDEDTSKKEKSKEKEFKLEVLVRTVSYLQHLLERAKSLEAQEARGGGGGGGGVCSRCGGQEAVLKEKKNKSSSRFSAAGDDDDDDGQGRGTMLRERSRWEKPSIDDDAMDLDDRYTSSSQSHNGSPHRLPSISTWLPSIEAENRQMRCNNRCRCCCYYGDANSAAIAADSSPEEVTMISRLPTPPSSAYFGPTQAPLSQVPPALNLNPLASRGSSSHSSSHHSRIASPLRTSDNDDEPAIASSSAQQRPAAEFRHLDKTSSRGRPSLAGPGQAYDFNRYPR